MQRGSIGALFERATYLQPFARPLGRCTDRCGSLRLRSGHGDECAGAMGTDVGGCLRLTAGRKQVAEQHVLGVKQCPPKGAVKALSPGTHGFGLFGNRVVERSH